MSSMTQSNEKPASSNSERERSKTGRFASKPKSDQATDGGSDETSPQREARLTTVGVEFGGPMRCSMVEVFNGPNTRVFYAKDFESILWFRDERLVQFVAKKGPDKWMDVTGLRMTELP